MAWNTKNSVACLEAQVVVLFQSDLALHPQCMDSFKGFFDFLTAFHFPFHIPFLLYLSSSMTSTTWPCSKLHANASFIVMMPSGSPFAVT